MNQLIKALNSLLILSSLCLVACSQGEHRENSESLKQKHGLKPLGFESCDNYLNKLRLCVDQAPPQESERVVAIYRAVLKDMQELLADSSKPEIKNMAAQACDTGEYANKNAMRAMGCEW